MYIIHHINIAHSSSRALNLGVKAPSVALYVYRNATYFMKICSGNLSPV